MTIYEKYKFVEDGSHYNGGAQFFGYGYRAVGEPRLKIVRKWQRRGPRKGQHDDEFYVDGVKVDDAAALAALAIPVAFTPEEIEALKKIGDEPADLRKAIGFDLWYSLHAKGAIEFGPPGHFRRTDVGRAALAGADE
jgi:hypothetical protein